jgi:hypothetical protein
VVNAAHSACADQGGHFIRSDSGSRIDRHGWAENYTNRLFDRAAKWS